MCGICGIVNWDAKRAVGEDELVSMRETLAHRGPDDAGLWTRGHAGLGVRRLSIIDIAGGHQPVPNEDGTLAVALNGEIYNYRELRRDLLNRGHRFRANSDTEVLVHLYEERGEEMLAELNGMFAFAIWDGANGRLFLARDRLGEKPLYYWRGRERFAFASEMKAFLKLSDFTPAVRRASIAEYLKYGYVPHPHSILEEVSKLPPAHYAIVEKGEVRTQRYWRPFGDMSSMRYEEAEERLRELLADSVRLRLVSDAPLGAFLSGGVDSSVVVGLMAGAAETVKTFTIGFEESRYDERRYARAVAEKFHTEHVEEIVRPDVAAIFEKLIWHLDEPLADSSAVPTYVLSQLTARSVKAALSGDGGDECFLGYPRYTAMWLASKIDRLPAFVRRPLFGRWWRRIPASAEQKGLLYRWKRFMAAAGKDAPERFAEWISVFDDAAERSILTAEFRDSLASEKDRLEFRRYAVVERSIHANARAVDLDYYLPCDLMQKVDRTSMAHGLEVRSPFLDHRVVEFAMSLPDGFKMRRGRGKRLLRSSFKDVLPGDILRRGKMGFAMPVGKWLRNELREMSGDLLRKGQLVERHVICRSTLEALLTEHAEGRKDNGARLWSLLCLEQWLRMFRPRS
jgi:asparagine synthase (glutamine-hydrolysing)